LTTITFQPLYNFFEPGIGELPGSIEQLRGERNT
jgi:hypothetical protein